MTQDELRRYTIPVKYNGMIIGGDIVEYPKTINVTAICIDAHSGETGLACTTNKDRREYTDLSQLWHYKDQEPPEIGRYILADTPTIRHTADVHAYTGVCRQVRELQIRLY